jgi:hypothetical protein
MCVGVSNTQTLGSSPSLDMYSALRLIDSLGSGKMRLRKMASILCAFPAFFYKTNNESVHCRVSLAADPHHASYLFLITACVGDANKAKQVHERETEIH